MCVECAQDEQLHCPECGNCFTDHPPCPGGCGLCGECADEWCSNCGMCVECAVDEGKHCPDCEKCHGDDDYCLLCNRCLDCGDQCENGCTDVCLICHLENEAACENCGACFIVGDNERCPGCGNCSECVDEWCDNCEMCVECAIDEEKHCPDCKECHGDGDYCLLCNRCFECGDQCESGCLDACLICHLENEAACENCGACFIMGDNERCPGCGYCSECVDEWCDNCEMCVECAVNEEKHCSDCKTCYENAEHVCPECNKCDACFDDWCDNCEMCAECATENDKHCPECKTCHEEAESYCEGCGKCSSCTDAHCPDCNMCGDCVRLCENCHYCEDDADICPDCGNACSECSTVCETCGMCESCTTICVDCGRHCSDCSTLCEECQTCEECADICGKCGTVCSNCGTMCPFCKLCEDCCAENSQKAGCGHDICIMSDDWDSHWESEHSGEEHQHIYNAYSYNETEHWQVCRVSSCGESMPAAAHTLGIWEDQSTGINRERSCSVCGYTEICSHPDCKWAEKDRFFCELACDRCGFTQTAAHQYDAGTVIREATDTTPGILEKSCIHCEHTAQETIPVIGHTHDWIKVSPTEPTCDEKGNAEYRVCDDCGVIELISRDENGNPVYSEGTDKDTIIEPSKEHTFSEWRVVKPATSTDKGEQEHVCTGCGYKETAEIPAKGGGSSVIYSYYIINASTNVGGSISPSGSVHVNEGRSQTFMITPNAGYAVSNVKIDGKSIGAVKSYTFENVRSNHTIEVVFMEAEGNPQTGVSVDMPEGSYYEKAVERNAKENIIKGTGETMLSPKIIYGRARIAAFPYRFCGKRK